jgi:hypothetical protein
MIISVHVPKTGGASFNAILKSHYGKDLLLDYNDKPMCYGNFSRNLIALSNYVNPRASYNKYKCIHGHFLPIKYRHLRNKRFAIWFRCPLERIISRYYHFKRNSNSNDLQFRKYIKNSDISLEEFVQIEHYQNLYSKYLFGMKLEDFDFVGITEKYSYSLDIFRAVFQVDIDYNSTHKNANPNKDGEKYIVDDGIKNLILQCNHKDYKIYQRALHINKSLERRYLGKTSI